LKRFFYANCLLFRNLVNLFLSRTGAPVAESAELLRSVKHLVSASLIDRFSDDSENDAHEFLVQLFSRLYDEIVDLNRKAGGDSSNDPIKTNFEFTICHYIQCTK
uniref:UCH domain-containing protein n=1 Tax=Soboliphyme baturini TaxID=241478 RepID=A0A183JAB4_9BILA